MTIFDTIAAGMIVVAILILAISVYGLIWMPTFAARLQSASLAVYLGTGLIVLAAMISIGRDVAEHGMLVLLILLVTSPISTHALIRAAVKHDARAHQLQSEQNHRKDVVGGKSHEPNPNNQTLD